MKAFILAAGEGRRMRPHTLACPKPLLDVDGATLLERHIGKLASAGITEIIINTSYLGHMIIDAMGDGSRYGVVLHYSHEDYPLETAGAINHALDTLGQDPFLLVNGDVWSDYDYANLFCNKPVAECVKQGGAHLILVENPDHNPEGDFALASDDRTSALLQPNRGVSALKPQQREGGTKGAHFYTFSGLSLMSPTLVSTYPRRREAFPLKEVLDWGVLHGRISAEIYSGFWLDVGTPERLQQLRSCFSGAS
ncbi:MAG: MurNAc alpha-1-phosphate uridylyltransferase [Lentisphaeria bacterium]|jgi:MurNAc alpha-1-phosphate uridylyltransferase